MTLKELAQALGLAFEGDPDCVIDHIASLEDAGSGALSFLSDKKYLAHLSTTGSSAVILREESLADCPVAALIADNPYLAYAKAAALLHPEPRPPAGIHPSAVVHASAQVDASASIGPQSVVEAGACIEAGVMVGPGCVIGENCRVGENTRLVARVTLCRDTQVGKRCTLHPGAVIGSDGFGLANEGGAWVKIPQIGRVVLGDDVDVGANTAIDRGSIGDTVIEQGVKLDNLVHVAHNVHIGAHSALAGCIGIAGSTRIGRHCMMGGGVAIAGHLEIGDGVIFTGMSMVTKSIKEPGVYSSGMAVVPAAKWRRNHARLVNLDDLARRLIALEKKST